MIPTSYIVRNIYAQTWGDPSNPHAVDVPDAAAPPPHGEAMFSLVTMASTLRRRLDRRHRELDQGLSPACP